MTAHVVCYSGGHSSGLVAIEVARKYGTADLVLVNHDINASVEHADIKRFKREVADYLGVPITYANMPGVERMDQFDVVVEARAFKVGSGSELCTSRLKTEPFYRWLRERFPGEWSADNFAPCVLYYGFDANEPKRIQRRAQILAASGYRAEFPLASWERTIQSTSEIGIQPPLTYDVFNHANCVGCLKAGLQHWYVVYCTRPDIWERAKWAEEEIGYTIHRDVSIAGLEQRFALMKRAGVQATEKIQPQRFWTDAKRAAALEEQRSALPCECADGAAEYP